MFEAAAVPSSTQWSAPSPPACRCPLTAGRKPRKPTHHGGKRLDRKFWINFTELSQDVKHQRASVNQIMGVELINVFQREASGTESRIRTWSGYEYTCKESLCSGSTELSWLWSAGQEDLMVEATVSPLPPAGRDRMGETTCWGVKGCTHTVVYAAFPQHTVGPSVVHRHC